MWPIAANRPEIRYAWCGPAALVIDTEGSAGAHHLTGFFFRQCRFLKDLRLDIRGEECWDSAPPCSAGTLTQAPRCSS